MFLINEGILILTGHPSTQVGFAQSRQRFASLIAISLVRPMFTSSERVVARYTGSSSGIITRSMSVRSLGFMLLRSSSRQAELRSVNTSIVSLVGSSSITISVVATDSSSFGVSSARCSSKCASSSCSSRLKVPIRLNISSQSTSEPSNSGPSMQTNFVFPPMVNLHAPHIPVPSTIMVFRLTSQGILCFCAVRFENFIMIGGPIANTLSICSCSINFSIPTVTTPFSP